jgi:hypothetical protein
MKIILAMPGHNDRPELQEQFWSRGIVATGLEPYTDLCFQANGKWNDLYPTDLLGSMEPDHIALEQYKHTKVRIDSGYIPKPYTHCFLDYEPKQERTWLGDKLNDGFNDADLDALAQMRRGVQEATDGLPLGAYRIPVFPPKPLKDGDQFLATSPREFATSLDWQWLHCYPQGRIDLENVQYVGKQIGTHFKVLSTYGKRVIPWLWPSYRIGQAEARNYGKWTIDILRELHGIDTVGIWVDLNKPNASEIQTRNMIAIAPHLRAWMEDE